jgi:hypothetical protein
LNLTVVQKEKHVGDFRLDLLCEDDEGKPVVVENQLEKTDHDHLGQLLTYLVNLEASTAIWVTTEPRPEHQKVIDWLNESTGADLSFFLVKVEASRIGNSPYAPLFTVVARPDDQSKEIGENKKEWAERHHRRLDFWKSLIERSKTKTKLFSTITPGRYHYISTGSGKAGLHFSYCIYMKCGTVELYIDAGHEKAKENKAVFDALYSQREAIEKEFGDTLEWQRLDTKRACRILKTFETGGLTQPDTWPALQNQMIDAMIRFDAAIRPRLAKISI